MTKRWVFGALLATGCVAEPIDAGGLPGEGESGTTWVMTPEGRRQIAFIVRDGHAMFEGDVDLGPVEDLYDRGGAANLAERWPLGHVPWGFDPDFDDADVTCDAGTNGMVGCIPSRTAFRTFVAELEVQLGIDFEEITPAQFASIPNHIRVQWAPATSNFGGSSSWIGMKGGEQTLQFTSGEAGMVQPWNVQPNRGTVRHEVLHALGLWHEQSRGDAEDAITIVPACIQSGFISQFASAGLLSADIGPYDYESVMHYAANQYSIDPMNCMTIIPEPPGPTTFGSGDLTAEDVNTLWEMYARFLDLNELDDKFGSALAVGDFDRDGYDDLAIGIPSETIGAATRAGAVIVYKGTEDGPVMWQRLTEADFQNHAPASGENFGTALAAGDFDGDGTDDLAIGAPNEDGAGAVFTYRGSLQTRLVPGDVLNQNTLGVGTNESGDKYGAALAMGPLTGLAVGGLDSLAVGAPFDRVPNATGGGTVRAGAVYIYTRIPQTAGGPPAGLAKPTRLLRADAAPAENDQFGAALAIGFLDTGDGRADLAVGGPGGSFVDTYRGHLPPEAPSMWSSVATFALGRLGTAGERYGAAVAIGPFTANRPFLAVGAPSFSSSRGRVYLHSGFAPGTSATVTDTVSTQPNDKFGAALAFGPIQGAGVGDLAIGVPGKVSNAGKIRILKDGSTATANIEDRTQANITSPYLPSPLDVDAGEQFGAAIAVGHFDGSQRPTTAHTGTRNADLAVGSPGEAPDHPSGEDLPAGAVYTLMGGGSLAPVGWQQLEQEYPNVR
jgi:hypothetical protein